MQGSLIAPGLADIEAMARRVYREIPATLRQYTDDVVIRVVDFPDEETLEALGIESPFDLLGLYHGVDLAQRSVADVREDVDRIFLYRRPLLDAWIDSGESLETMVRHVLVHEIGHHFGLSDDDMARIESKA